MTRRSLALAGGVVLAAVMLGNRGFRRLVQRALEIRRMRAELSRLQREETELRSQIRQARSDDRAIESSARKDLGLVKPGEIEYRFPPPGRASQ